MEATSITNTKKLIRTFLYAFKSKFNTIFLKKTTVSSSCQIPDLQEKYQQLRFGNTNKTNINKIFVEIGGNDGETCSNTSFLADQGWRGLYVEPIKDLATFAKIRHIFNDVSVENVAISESNGTQLIYSMGLLTTLSLDNVRVYSELDWSKSYTSNMKEITIQTKTLENVFKRHNIPFVFDLLVVDVEGHEETIINSLFLSSWKPNVIIIELEDQHKQFKTFSVIADSHSKTRKMIVENGYIEFWKDDVNTIFKRI